MAAFHILFYFITTAFVVVLSADHCTFEGITYTIDQQFNPKPCQVCMCRPNTVICSSIDCPPTQCVDSVHKQDVCCPVCPNGPNCKYGNHVIKFGELYTMANGDVCQCPLILDTLSHKSLTQAVCGQNRK